MGEELAIAGAIVAIFGICFGIFWKIIIDVKKSAHARIDRVEENFITMEVACNARLGTYINKGDMKDLRTDMNSQFNGLTTRIDSLLLAFKSGQPQ